MPRPKTPPGSITLSKKIGNVEIVETLNKLHILVYLSFTFVVFMGFRTKV